MGNLSQPIDKQFQSNSTSEGIKRAKCIAFGPFFSVNSKGTLLPSLASTPWVSVNDGKHGTPFQKEVYTWR